MSLTFAYGTNGLADHRIDEAVRLLADTGFAGVSLTLDHQHLDPGGPDPRAAAAELKPVIDAAGLRVVIETGARFVLDPRAKHRPNLLDTDGRDRRLAMYKTAVEVAAELGSPIVHLWSGHLPSDVDAATAWQRLVAGVSDLLEFADAHQIDLAFEPEPGMLVENIADVRRLTADLDDHPRFGFTLDIGHCICLEPEPVPHCVGAVADRLKHVQIEDMRRGVHEHLPFGDGELDLPEALQALIDADYQGLVSVELPRHSHTAHTAVPAAYNALTFAAQSITHQSVVNS